MNIQFKKGVLELCVLSLLKTQDRYGYELASILSEKIRISDGGVYPVLRRLKQERHVETYLEESTEGPPRKYYRLTDRGGVLKDNLRSDWEIFSSGLNDILKGDETDE